MDISQEKTTAWKRQLSKVTQKGKEAGEDNGDVGQKTSANGQIRASTERPDEQRIDRTGKIYYSPPTLRQKEGTRRREEE